MLEKELEEKEEFITELERSKKELSSYIDEANYRLLELQTTQKDCDHQLILKNELIEKLQKQIEDYTEVVF